MRWAALRRPPRRYVVKCFFNFSQCYNDQTKVDVTFTLFSDQGEERKITRDDMRVREIKTGDSLTTLCFYYVSGQPLNSVSASAQLDILGGEEYLISKAAGFQPIVPRRGDIMRKPYYRYNRQHGIDRNFINTDRFLPIAQSELSRTISSTEWGNSE